MLNERQLKIVDLLEQQPRTPGELAQQTGVSGTALRAETIVAQPYGSSPSSSASSGETSQYISGWSSER